MPRRTYQVNFVIEATDQEITNSPAKDEIEFFEITSEMLKRSIDEGNEEFSDISEGISFRGEWIGKIS